MPDEGLKFYMQTILFSLILNISWPYTSMQIFKLIGRCNCFQAIGFPFRLKFAEPKSVLVVPNRRKAELGHLFWNEIKTTIHYVLSYDTL